MIEEREPPLVLVVAADDLVRAFMVRSLRAIGYRVVDVAIGEAAIEAHDARPPEFTMVVLDLGMPGMRGLAAGDAIRECTPGVPILYMSGASDPARIGDRLLEPRAGFLEKPCTIDEVREGLGSVRARAG